MLGGCGLIWLAGALPGVLSLQMVSFQFRVDGPIILIADRSSRASSAGSPALSAASGRHSAELALRCALLAISCVSASRVRTCSGNGGECEWAGEQGGM